MSDVTLGGGLTWRRGSWLRILGGGVLLWILSVGVTFLTGNANLIPTIILLGSFVVPVAFVAYAFEHHSSSVLTEHRIFVAFIYGGVLGVLGASLLEALFIGRTSLISYIGVGLVEEASKLIALWLIARRLGSYATRDGIVLGAAVGFGFAAFESAGYAFNALFTLKGLSLLGVVETEVLRGILTPVGHGLWTAILGGALFYAARGGRLRLTRGVLGWYLVVSLLHGLWDASHGLATIIVLLLLLTSTQTMAIDLGGVPDVTAAEEHLFTVLNWVFLALDAIVGLLLLRYWWRRGGRALAT
jgi:RsiW-degrading membrane proteinase PrsW (M82 family)